MTTNYFVANAEAKGSVVCHSNFASLSVQTKRLPPRPVLIRTKTPNELLREMQGLQLYINTPASTGSDKSATEPSLNEMTSNNNYRHQEMLTPPSTPALAKIEEQFPLRWSMESPQISELNFLPDLSQAQLLGEGVWSKVYRIRAVSLAPMGSGLCSPPTPPSTPQKVSFGFPHAYAIKTATRSDAGPVFEAEARILTHIQQHESSPDHVVPFLGLCTGASTPSLLFHCADAGTLESLTETTLHQPLSETIDLFLHILPQLLHGLCFLHSTARTVHADIKPANILLTSTSSLPAARYADFSTSFISSTAPSQYSGAGTWSFMAPEQLSRDKDLSTPTFFSDVYALGVSLLAFLCGANPFQSMLDNVFRLREAVKMGDVLNWALQDPASEMRLERLQTLWECKGGKGKLLALLSPALKKKREDRPSAEEWVKRVDVALSGLRKDKTVGLGIRC